MFGKDARSRNFIEQIKVDTSGKSKILGIYINPNEFPKSGLIVASSQNIYTYNPVYGNVNNSLKLKKEILAIIEYTKKGIVYQGLNKINPIYRMF